MNQLKKLLLISLTIIIISCSSSDLLNSIIPDTGYTVRKDVEYAKGPRHKLDIYIPDNLTKPADVIVFFYGGRWSSGSKDIYKFVGQAFATKGYITVIADYRLHPEIKYPEFLNDNANAFSWAHKNIKDYGGNPDRLFLAGHSAGAYNAIMLAVNDKFLKAAGGQKSWIKGAIGFAGPYDFLPFTDEDVIQIFSTEEDKKTQPINYVGKNEPPILLLAGDKDEDVKPKNTINLANKLKNSGNNITSHIYPDVAHIGIILSLAQGFRGKASTLEDVSKFIESTK